MTGLWKGSSERTAQKAEWKAKKSIIEAVLKAGHPKHQRLALLNALTDKRLRDLVSSLGIDTEETRIGIDVLRNMRKVLNRARMKSHRGRVSKDRRQIAKSLLLTTVQTLLSTMPKVFERSVDSWRFPYRHYIEKWN